MCVVGLGGLDAYYALLNTDGSVEFAIAEWCMFGDTALVSSAPSLLAKFTVLRRYTLSKIGSHRAQRPCNCRIQFHHPGRHCT